MKSKIFQICVVALTFFILNISVLFGQFSSRDSMIIKKYDAIKITDSIYSNVPPNIRIIAIEFLSKSGLDPKEFYTLGIFHPSIFEVYINIGTYESVGSLGLFRINGLRDLSDGPLHFGASGGKDDDILLIFDTGYKKVMRMTINE